MNFKAERLLYSRYFCITFQDYLTASGTNGENGALVHATMESWSRLGHGKSYKSRLDRVKSAMEVTRTQRLVVRGYCGAYHHVNSLPTVAITA